MLRPPTLSRVLMDVRMPVMDALEATRRIKQEMPQTSVVMVTMHENPDYLFEAVKAGAASYVLKYASGEAVGGGEEDPGRESPPNQELAMRLLVRRSRESSGGESSREDAEVGSVETRCGGTFSEAAEEDSGKVNESLASHSHTSFWSRVFLAPAREAQHVGCLTAVDPSLGYWSGFRIQGRYHSSTYDLIKNEY